jgi:hypothetical protein
MLRRKYRHYHRQRLFLCGCGVSNLFLEVGLDIDIKETGYVYSAGTPPRHSSVELRGEDSGGGCAGCPQSSCRDGLGLR